MIFIATIHLDVAGLAQLGVLGDSLRLLNYSQIFSLEANSLFGTQQFSFSLNHNFTLINLSLNSIKTRRDKCSNSLSKITKYYSELKKWINQYKMLQSIPGIS